MRSGHTRLETSSSIPNLEIKQSGPVSVLVLVLVLGHFRHTTKFAESVARIREDPAPYAADERRNDRRFVAAYVRTSANESMSLSTQIGKVHENDDFVHLFDAASASERPRRRFEHDLAVR